ncbi:MAG: peptidoglycan DD-metalloendopeptidase family protein [Lachnospiraceae bacterium]|nr:peptidoglycan DD-metalloendopeptidase family protein [Lachnospiraceae bacterium]
MRKIKRIFCLALVSVMCLGMVPTTSVAKTDSEIKESIRKKQEKIKESQKIKGDLQSNIKNAKAIKGELEGLKSDVAKYITRIDEELASIAAQIEEYNTLIENKEEEIVEMTKELEVAVEKEEEHYETMKKQIKFMYERGDSLYIDLMLNTSGFSDFLTKANYIEQLSAYENKKMQEYTEAREWTELCKASLESEKQVLDEAKLAQEKDEETLQEILEEKEREMSSYNSKIKDVTQQIKDYEADLAEEQAVISALEKEIEKERASLGGGKGPKYDGGMFTFPCPSYVKVSDEFGWRTDPITGASSYHSGVDLAAPAGSAILAAYDGVVVAATYNWSMGNYVLIDHGDGLYTIYMHSSALYVSAGQSVSKGATIAAVGTTGRSTGNHLHFGVRLNGVYVSPWNYLK